MTAVVTVFGGVGDGIAKSRRALEQFDRMRTAAQQLRVDLAGVTATPDGNPARPEQNPGYLEISEGGIVGTPQAVNAATNTTNPPVDYTVGVGGNSGNVRSDILMFTTRNAVKPFVGRYQGATLQSDVAEVAWFLRGTTLHRRVLLVAPGVGSAIASYSKPNFYANNDISVHIAAGQIVPNSLGDLTKRENRFAHPVSGPNPNNPNGPPGFPFDIRRWGLLGLPTMAECSSSTWMGNWTNGSTPLPVAMPTIDKRGVDMWDKSTDDKLNVSKVVPDQFLAQDGTRLADDVVLTHVIGFDVKVWDPGALGYCDCG